MTTAVTPLTNTPLELGEGARHLGDRLVLVDILSGDLYCHAADTPGPLKPLAHVDLPLGAVAPIRDQPGAWIAAVGDGVAVLEPDGTLAWLDQPESRHNGRTRMNDGVCDPAGRFWAGSMAYDGQSSLGSLYRVDPDGSVHEVLDDLIIANGPAFTADGSTMFLADSGRATLTRFRITDDGTPTEPFVLLREESCAVPDGLTTDATGAVWVAMWGAAEIRRYSPEGNLLTRIALPAAQPTSVALHGNRALVTTARLGLEQPTTYDGLLLSAALATEPGAAVSLPPRFFG